MLRPKSFLDDLLGTEPDPLDTSLSSSSAGQRQRKSVRFFDQGDMDDPSAVSRGRPHSSTLDSLLNSSRSEPGATPRPRSTESGARSRADWLGLDGEEADTARKVSSEQSAPSRVSTTRETPSSGASRVTPSLGASESAGDWINAGLRARQPKPTESESRPSFLQTAPGGATTAGKSPGETRPWQPRIAENSKAPTRQMADLFQPASGLSNVLSETAAKYQSVQQSKEGLAISDNSGEMPKSVGSAEKSEPMIAIEEAVTGHEEEGGTSSFKETTSAGSQSTVFLQTKLRILSLEKTFLEQTVTQMKDNHQEELKSMVSLYEQQMRMTSDMYKRHEEMIQEERDRRISELKSQLDHSQREMEEMRLKFQERLAGVESEWQTDVQRIREGTSTTTRQLVEQHQEEVHRLEERLRADNESAMQTSTDLVKHHSKSVGELLAKWENSAYTIEQLQKSVVARQEDLMRQQSLDGQDMASRKLADIELQWKAFVTEMELQRSQLEEVVKAELERNNAEDRKRLEEEWARVRQDKSHLEAMKVQFSQEVNQWRQEETQQAEKWCQERDKLRQDVLLFEERRSLLETLYKERKRTLDEEQARVSKQGDELTGRRTQLEEEQVRINRVSLSLQTEEQMLTAKKELFEREKEQLALMAEKLAIRADELEKLSEVALKEKLDGMTTLDEMDSFQSEIDSKLANIEEATGRLRQEEQRLLLERAQLEQQWAMLRELKESLVCNLCGSAINLGGQVRRAEAVTDSLLTGPAGGNSSSYSFAMFAQRANATAPTSRRDHHQSSPLFQSLLNGGVSFLHPGPGRTSTSSNPDMNTSYWLGNGNAVAATDVDQDQRLLFWQMSAQQDAASLAEETRFLLSLRKNGAK